MGSFEINTYTICMHTYKKTFMLSNIHVHIIDANLKLSYLYRNLKPIGLIHKLQSPPEYLFRKRSAKVYFFGYGITFTTILNRIRNQRKGLKKHGTFFNKRSEYEGIGFGIIDFKFKIFKPIKTKILFRISAVNPPFMFRSTLKNFLNVLTNKSKKA